MTLKRNRSPKDKKDKMIRVRVSESEYQAIQEIAENEGLAVGNLIRLRVFGNSSEAVEEAATTAEKIN